MIFGTNTRLRTPEVGWQADELAHDLTATAKVAVLAPRALACVSRLKLSMNRSFVFLAAVWLLVNGLAFAAEPATATAPRKVVIIAGKKSHGPEGNRIHDYPWSAKLVKVMLDNSNIRDQVRVEFHRDGWPADQRTLEDADSIMVISDGRDGDLFSEALHLESPERVALVERLMKRGCGLVTFHFSTFAPDKYADRILDWNGGYFDWEENGARKWYSAIKTLNSHVEIASPVHAISRGVKPFKLNEEFYYNLRFQKDDARLRPLLNVPALGGRAEDGNVVAWAVERADGGRGFGTTCGHFYDNWKADDFRKLVLNAVAWTAKVEVPAGGVESRYFAHDAITRALDGVRGGDRAVVDDSPIRVLMFAGNEAHKWHNWERTTPALKALLERDSRVRVDVSNDIEDLAKKPLRDYQVILQNYVNWQDPRPLSDASKAVFTNFVNSGGGLVLVHFANGAFHFSLPQAAASDWPEYRRLVRRVWNHQAADGQPTSNHDAFGPFTVNFTGAPHPVTAGLKAFEVTDELYFNQHGVEPIEPLIAAVSKVSKRAEPLAWSYSYGEGRVFQTLLGHSEKTYAAFEAREMIRRAVAWVAKRKVSATERYDDPNPASPAASVPPAAPKKSAGQASLSPAFGQALSGGLVVAGKPDYRARPLTIECRTRLVGKASYNILVASDSKASAEHWELYTHVGSGMLSLYQPGRGGDFNSGVDICDGQWHALAAVIEPERVRLYVDGRLVQDAAAKPMTGTPIPDGLAFGSLVEGGVGCDGVVDDVRLSRGVREISGVPSEPLKLDTQTIGLWNFDDLKAPTSLPSDPWAIEDAQARAALPEFQEIPAAKVSELTAAANWPRASSMTNWHRSLGDATSSRFSALAQINRENVKHLEVAWTYRSKDGVGNLQCNPIIVDGMMFAPTAGHHIVALNAATGAELWRFKPEIRKDGMRLEDFPARRGLVFWPGDSEAPARILFTCGNWIYALDPKTGQPLDSFGEKGRTVLPAGGTVAGAVFKHVFVVPGFSRDVFGYDLRTGQRLWTFHTLPQPGEFGHDTWSRVEDGANCWGGMALDEQRGIAYVATGSPKPNFVGTGHHGDNLFSNCILALDALTGKRLWHFQEIRHDIWDWDIPAPPNLVTVTRDGRRVDAVAQVTKLGNTLLLDRVSGKPLFPVRLRRAPASKLPGERTAPYQPDIQLPEPFARQQFSRADVTTRSEEAREYIEKRVANVNSGWFEPFEEGKPTVLNNIHGGAEWTGAAFDPTSGCLYVSANEIPWIVTVFRDDPEPARDPKNPTLGEKLYQQNCASCHGPDRIGIGTAPPLRGLRHRLKDADVLAVMKTGRNLMPPAPPMTDAEQKELLDFIFLRDRIQPSSNAKPSRPAYTYNGYPKLLDHEDYPGNKPPWGTLNCIDLNTGKLRWKVPLGEYPELTAQGIPKTGTENFGGAMVTAGGLVFCSGTRDNLIRAFDAKTGEELWSHKLPFHGTAPPATYAVGGRQFVVIAATGGGKLGGPTGDNWVAFTLHE